PEDRDATKAMTTPGTTRRQSPLAQHARQAIGHDPAAWTESLAGAPDVGTTDAVEDDVHALVREATNLLHEVELSVVDRDTAQLRDGGRPMRGTRAVHLKPAETPELQQRRAHPACRAVNQHALARFDSSGAMQHLVRRDVVEHEADALGRIEPGWHRHELTVRQTDELRVRAVDRQRGNDLARLDS